MVLIPSAGKLEMKLRERNYHVCRKEYPIYYVPFVCKKIYESSFNENEFCDEKIVEFNYPNKDFHQIYVGKIEKILLRE